MWNQTDRNILLIFPVKMYSYVHMSCDQFRYLYFSSNISNSVGGTKNSVHERSEHWQERYVSKCFPKLNTLRKKKFYYDQAHITYHFTDFSCATDT